MIVLIILIFSIMTLLVYPLFQKEALDLIYLDYVVDERKQLKQKKANIIMIIKELDFDYETGKLSKEDYKNLRDKYEAQAVNAMKALELEEQNRERYLKKIEEKLSNAKI
ncbi:hypothetical protein MRY82_10020 [bacterium]|nr:hypothetical protein [bacterium]